MVIEHTFVTTLDAEQTMRTAMQFLALRGFTRPDQAAFPVDQQWTTLEMRRGKKSAARARSIAQLPQTAHVQWDRGRVTVVLSIEPSYKWGGSGAQLGMYIGAATDNPRKMKVHMRMLNAIALGLEQVLTQNAVLDAAAQQWAAADQEAERLASRRFWRIVIILVAVLGLLALVIVLAAMSK